MLRLDARAKINWTLDIVGKRDDGYHEMDMLLQSISLCDHVALSPLSERLELLLSGNEHVPCGEDNLAMRAARALRARGDDSLGALIALEKRVPMGAGMGGGSADAAAVLIGLNALWRLGLSIDALCEIGFTLGADVPFCIRGGLMRARGAGELLQRKACARTHWLVVVQPLTELSTRAVFAAYDALPVSSRRPDTDGVERALALGQTDALPARMGNVLEPAARRLCPEIGQAASALLASGAVTAMMTGSGSAVYGVFSSREHAAAAFSAIKDRYAVCHIAQTAEEGIVITES